MDNKGFENDTGGGGGGSMKGSEKSQAKSMESSTVSLDMPQGVATKPYPGMGKEDLLRFSQTPFWVRLRMTCLIIFWLGWTALLVSVVILTVVAPRCADPPEQRWYQKSVVYQIFVRSFYDSDGDGIGDINGITSKLDYLEELNVEAIALSSFYESHYGQGETSDFGYDVTDHTAIDSDYGTDADFERLLNETHKRDMKVIIDFIPNHTGDKHPWFLESDSGNPADKANYYVWQECGTPAGTVPNDWTNVYDRGNDGSAWTESTNRPLECYLHQHLDTQPDLNLRSMRVREELEDILRYWLDKDVDGFRVMNARYLFEDSEFRDDINDCPVGNPQCYTTTQPENFEIIPTWRAILEEYSSERERVLIIESQGDTVNDTSRYYGYVADSGAHLPLNFQLTNIAASTTGEDIKELVEDYMNGKPSHGTADWLTGFQDNTRKANELGENMVGALAVLTMTLPGTAFIYYGEELGMVDGTVTTFPDFNSTDPTGLERDKFSTPMQWDSTGGFVNGTADPWIPVNPDTITKNVADQDAAENSTLNMYRTLAELHRTEDGLAYGDFEFAFVDDEIFSFIRHFDGTNRFLVAVNFGSSVEEDIDFAGSHDEIPNGAELVVVTREDALRDGRKVGDDINLREVDLGPGEAAVFMWPYSR